MRKINTAILGCGSIAGLKKKNLVSSFNHAKELNFNKNYNLVACVDRVEKKRILFAKTYKIPFSFNSLSNLFKSNLEIDLIVVCTGAKKHFSNLKKIINCKIANVFCEKPLCTNINDLNKLNNLILKKRTKLFTNFNRKEDFAIQDLKKTIKKNKIGKIELIKGIYSNQLLNNGIHLIDLLFYLVGDLKIIRILSPKKNKFYSFMLESKRKVPIFINNLKTNNFSLFEIDLIFEKGRIKYTDNGMKIEKFYVEKNKFFTDKKKLKYNSKTIKTDFLKTFRNQYKKIYSEIKLNKRYNEFKISSKIHKLCFNIVKRSS